MAESNAFKTLEEKDIVATRTLLHEAIPLTGSIVSGTYGDTNIKNPPHEMFQSVYDYSYLSSSANHIFDITVGLYNPVAGPIVGVKAKNVYNQMTQVLVGYDVTGSIMRFDKDGDLTGGTKYENVVILPFSRLLVKDEIKKGTFSMTVGTDASYLTTGYGTTETFTDTSGSDGYFVNSPVGEYGILFNTGGDKVGLLYYQAGIAVLDLPTAFNVAHEWSDSSDTLKDLLDASIIKPVVDGFRNRIVNIQFNNTTELNSTIYFCRANHNEFNYSTNPTYVDGSKIRVKTNSTDEPIAYITSIGLYNDKNELMATAKLSEPLRKSPSTEFTLRARLDY
tara:strand:+ start:7935 stop:8942 length:1008 start_codon:yes stop_codon:yes gene_type:complete